MLVRTDEVFEARSKWLSEEYHFLMARNRLGYIDGGHYRREQRLSSFNAMMVCFWKDVASYYIPLTDLYSTNDPRRTCRHIGDSECIGCSHPHHSAEASL